MRFTLTEIEAACELRDLSLAWEPASGHFVLDPTGFCKSGSPFQDRVYFILNYEYFMRKVGGVEQFKRIMIWLPACYDARGILRSLKVSDAEVAEHLRTQRSVEDRTELLTLYELIKSRLIHNSTESVSEATVP